MLPPNISDWQYVRVRTTLGVAFASDSRSSSPSLDMLSVISETRCPSLVAAFSGRTYIVLCECLSRSSLFSQTHMLIILAVLRHVINPSTSAGPSYSSRDPGTPSSCDHYPRKAPLSLRLWLTSHRASMILARRRRNGSRGGSEIKESRTGRCVPQLESRPCTSFN